MIINMLQYEIPVIIEEPKSNSHLSFNQTMYSVHCSLEEHNCSFGLDTSCVKFLRNDHMFCIGKNECFSAVKKEGRFILDKIFIMDYPQIERAIGLLKSDFFNTDENLTGKF